MENEIKFLLNSAIQNYVDKINEKFHLKIVAEEVENYSSVKKQKQPNVKKQKKNAVSPIMNFIDRKKVEYSCVFKNDDYLIFENFLIEKKSEIVVARKDGSRLTRDDCLYCKEMGLNFIMKM